MCAPGAGPLGPKRPVATDRYRAELTEPVTVWDTDAVRAVDALIPDL
jgi:hypothetical protein